MNLNTGKDQVIKNIMSSSRGKTPWLDMSMHSFIGTRVAIVGGSPSLKDMLDDLGHFDGIIIATNGAYDYLVDSGIHPDVFFQLDARKCNQFAKNCLSTCSYILASQCHKDSFDSIDPDYLVHVEVDDFPAKKVKQIAKNKDIENYTTIVGRGTVGMTAIALAHTMGFREFHLYGMDSSFSEDHHAYEQSQNDNDTVITHELCGIEYKTTPELCNQLWHFQNLLPLLADSTIVMKSEGLIKGAYNEFETRSK